MKFKVGDKVKINQESIYFSLDCQLPHGVIGHVTRDHVPMVIGCKCGGTEVKTRAAKKT